MRCALGGIWFLAGCCVIGLMGGSSLRAEPPGELAAEERILDALESRMDFEVLKAPLAQAVQLLRERSGIPIRMDKKGLADIGLDGDVAVNFRGKNFRLRSILAHLLSPCELTTIIRDGELVITNRDEADASLQVRIYSVADIESKEKWGQPIHCRESDQIVDMLQSIVAPMTWDAVGGPATIQTVKNHLVIRQSPQAHREISRMLSLLRVAIEAHGKWDGKSRPIPGLENGASLRLGDDDEAAISRALDAKVTLTFEKTPLSEVVAFLAGKTNIAFAIDQKGITDAGIEMETEISVEAKDLPLRVALRQMLRPHDLSFRIWNETLQITTPDGAGESPSARIYPVYDLVGKPTDWDILDDEDDKETTPDELIDVISSSVEPTTWDTVGGPGSVRYFPQPGVLFVSQSDDVHDQIAKLLAQLREKLPVVAKRDPKADEQRQVTRVYRLLQPAPPAAPAPAAPATGAAAGSVPPAGVPMNTNAEGPSASELAELVQKVVAPESWREAGHSVHAAKGVLVVKQRMANHQKIERLLMELGVFVPSLTGGGQPYVGPIPVVGQRGMGGLGGGGFFAVPAEK